MFKHKFFTDFKTLQTSQGKLATDPVTFLISIIKKVLEREHNKHNRPNKTHIL